VIFSLVGLFKYNYENTRIVVKDSSVGSFSQCKRSILLALESYISVNHGPWSIDKFREIIKFVANSKT